jgi:hypothetical protein
MNRSTENKSAPVPADDRTTSSQTLLDSLTIATYRLQVAASHVLFHSTPKRALELANRCWAWLQCLFQDGGEPRRILSICTSGSGIDVQPTNIPGNTSHHMQSKTKNIAPSAPAPFIVMNVTTTPASILDNLIYRFMVSGTNRHLRIAAIDLNLAFTFDETAEGELLQALGCSDLNVTTAAGLDCMLEILKRAGAINPDFDPAQPDLIRLKFNAAPLLDLLKAMPHRIGGLALSREAYEDMYGHSN